MASRLGDNAHNCQVIVASHSNLVSALAAISLGVQAAVHESNGPRASSEAGFRAAGRSRTQSRSYHSRVQGSAGLERYAAPIQAALGRGSLRRNVPGIAGTFTTNTTPLSTAATALCYHGCCCRRRSITLSDIRQRPRAKSAVHQLCQQRRKVAVQVRAGGLADLVL